MYTAMHTGVQQQLSADLWPGRINSLPTSFLAKRDPRNFDFVNAKVLTGLQTY